MHPTRMHRGSSEEFSMRDALVKSGLFAAVFIVAAPMALAALTTVGARLRG